MTLETDLLIDRRRLKRRLLLWRLLTVAAVLLVAAILIGKSSTGGGDHVARVKVEGTLISERKTIKALEAALEDTSARAVLLMVNSPGGAVAAGEAIHDLVERVAAKKPVVAVMGATAASAGYMISLPAARIYALNSTLTGSIGVLLPTGEVSGLLRWLGITDETLTSGPLKNVPSLTKPMTEQGRAVMQALIDDLYDQFVGMVAKGRKMEPARVRELADGRAYTGRQALALGLIDAIGVERDAREWLAAERAIPTTLPARDIRIDTLRDKLFGDDAEGLFGRIVKTLLSQSVSLDGGWALWQPGLIRQ